jgi:hypothetical protein
MTNRFLGKRNLIPVGFKAQYNIIHSELELEILSANHGPLHSASKDFRFSPKQTLGLC